MRVDKMRVLSFGGGVNSTALLFAMCIRNEKPDLVLFSDTGGEFPETYAHVEEIEEWCRIRSIEFVRVSNAGRGQGDTLEQNCLERKELPSLAYGFKGCSVKWKRQPMDRYLAKHAWPQLLWENDQKVERCIGIDAGERHRAVLTEDARYRYRYPLVEWGIDRDECVRLIAERGIKVPRKSSCFFCPAMRRREIFEMQSTHPELLERALKIESNAVTHTVRGLGRNWSWQSLLQQDEKQGKLFPEMLDAPCGCHDQAEEP